MDRDDFHKLVQPRVTCFTTSNLLLGYMRLCLAIADIHKGVTSKVLSKPLDIGFLGYCISFDTGACVNWKFFLWGLKPHHVSA